eukprot:m.132765 g.132765  ORF g.132765 m.132765 type:complete len:374 (-) comp16859_c0_seq2:225-1346(-)
MLRTAFHRAAGSSAAVASVLRHLMSRRIPRAAMATAFRRGSTYTAAVCTELGKPLQLQALERKPLKPGQVRIAVRAAAVNFADILQSLGKYQEQPPLPFVSGMEVSGVVVEAGEGSRVSVGMRVVALTANGGGFATETVTKDIMCWPLPDALSFERGVAVPVSYGTAWVGLVNRAQLQPGETVLVTAAGGATGCAAVDIAKHLMNCKVIAAAGSEDKLQIAKGQGADHLVNYNTSTDLRGDIKAASGGKGVDVAFDAVGGDVFDHSLRSLRWGGRAVVIGFAGGKIPKIAANLLLVKNISAVGVYWGAHAKHDPMLLHRSVSETLEAAGKGILSPLVARTFPLENVQEAFDHILARENVGKVVLTTGSDSAKL